MSPIPIVVPLYKSYHCIERFIKSLELEKKQQFVCYFLDNEFETEDNRPKIDLLVNKICEENKFNSNRYPILVSSKNNLYSESVNMLVYEADHTYEFDTFLILNPDCYALNVNWLSDMIDCWKAIKRGFDKNICTLGALQWGNEEKTQVWHWGCMWKAPEAKCHPADWQHIHGIPEHLLYTGNGIGFHRVDGNTGSAIMIDHKKFVELGCFDSKNFPHYSSDFILCERAQQKGWTHYCCSVEFFHRAGSSVQK